MQVYVQTRGRTLDYAFLGDAPDERWWSQYRNQTAFEDPTILLHSDGRRWRVCLSGIESTRKDRVGTTIRYTLVVEGECNDKSASTTARVVIGSWLADATRKQPLSALNAELDSVFDEAFVEQTLIDRSREAKAAVAQRAAAALARLSVPASARQDVNENGSWVGSAGKERPRDAFMGRVEALLGGVAGRALFLNLVGTEDEARLVVDQGGAAAILIEDDAGALGSSIVSLEKKKPSATPPAAHPRAHRRMWVAVLAIGVPLLAVLLWLLLRSNHR